MDSQSDEQIINELLNSNDLKDIIKSIVKSESKGKRANDSAISKLADLLNRCNLSENDRVASSKNKSTMPINDINCDPVHIFESEVEARCTLASLFRLLDMEGWTRTIYNMISMRFGDKYLVNPFGLLYHELTASSLVLTGSNGNILDTGSTILKINESDFKLHRSFYSARSDVKCIVQITIPDVVAVASTKSGLLPCSKEAQTLLRTSNNSFTGGVTYHDLVGDYETLAENSGQSKVIFLRNTGLLICAESVPEAWLLTKMTVAACKNQIRLLQLCGKEDLNASCNDFNINTEPNFVTDYKLEAEVEFEAMMRLLDNAGYRTGYKYKSPKPKTKQSAPRKSGVKYEEKKGTEESVNQQVSVTSDGDTASEVNGTDMIQICPMPPSPMKENGDIVDAVNEVDVVNEVDALDEVDSSKEKRNSTHDESDQEKNMIKEMCHDIIDRSVKYVQENPTEPSCDDA